MKTAENPGPGSQGATRTNNGELLFLYHKDYSVEVADWRAGKVPGTRLFGLDGFIDGVEPGWRGSFLRVRSPLLLKILYRLRLFKVFQALGAALRSRRFKALAAVHESNAYWPLALKRIGLLKTPLVVMNVALLQQDLLLGPRNWVLRRLLAGADAVLCYAADQLPAMNKHFGLEPRRLGFIPLSVDADFFSPRQRRTEDFVLSVGTNPGKDFETLIEAARGLPFPVRIITDEANLKHVESLGPLPGNVVARIGHMPIDKLRNIYAEARFFALPLHDVKYSTGQTIALENMAMGKAVIASRIGCLIDYIEDGVTGLLVEPGNPGQLREKMEYLWSHPEEAERLGRAARESVLARFSLTHYHEHLLEVLEKVVESGGLQVRE